MPRTAWYIEERMLTMFIRTTWTHIKFLLSRKSARITFLVFFLVMLQNFVFNVLEFRGADTISMYHPMKFLSLSYNYTNYKADTALLMLQLMPLLVAFPAGLAMAADHSTGAETMLVARLGKKRYVTSRLLAIVIATAIVFAAPFLLEIVLNCVSFPLGATGDFINADAFSQEYIDATANYVFPALYHVSPYLYAILGTIRFGLFAGLLAGFATSVSLLFPVKFKVFLLLPPFLLLYISSSCKVAELKWFNYIQLFSDAPKNYAFWLTACLLLVAFCVCSVLYSGRKDCLR